MLSTVKFYRTLLASVLFVSLAATLATPESHAVQADSPDFDLVTCVAFHPNNQIIAIVGHDKLVRIWDITGPEEIATMKGHTSEIQSVAFSKDGKFLISGGSDKVARLWDVSNPKKPKLVATLEGNTDKIYGVALSPNNKLAGTAGVDNTVRVFDITKATGGGGGAVANPGGGLTGIGGKKGSDPAPAVGVVKLRPKHTLTGHSDKVWAVSFSPDSKLIASASSDKKLKIWDLTLATPEEIASEEGHSSSILSMNFSADGKSIATAALDQKVIVWDVTDPKNPSIKHELQKHEKGAYTVSMSPNGKYVASGSSDQKVHLWNISGDDPVLAANMAGHSGSVECVTFSPDSKWLASGSGDHTVRIWSVGQNKLTLKHTIP